MKISNSKKQLAKIIHENGGWRDGAEFAWYGNLTKKGWFGRSKPWYVPKEKSFRIRSKDDAGYFPCRKLHNWHQTILSRDEYFYLYPAPDADGWIEWKGGERPVEDGAKLDLKFIDGGVVFGVDTDWSWVHEIGKCNIIAYRLHNPEHSEQEYPDGIKPIDHAKQETTIEQLAADYRNLLDFAQRKQQEADDAKADADAKLAELVAAGKALGLVLSIAGVEPELVITDWRDLRVGDEVALTSPNGGGVNVGEVGAIRRIDDRTMSVSFPSQAGHLISRAVKNWKFIRRP